MKLPLKIGILSFARPGKRASISDIMLKKTAQFMGHQVRIFRNARFQFAFTAGKPTLFYKDEIFAAPDVMIIRPYVFANVDHEISTVKHLQLLDIPVVNHYLPIVRAKNKVRTLQILSHQGIPIPKTVVIHSLEYLDAAITKIGQFPLIMKTPLGSQGMGVSIVESKRSLLSMLDLIKMNFRHNQIIIQEYVKEAKGKDIRVFIVGGRIIAVMERKAHRGEFRSNFHRGGSVSLADISEEEKKMAISAVSAIGLDIAGVDIIRTAEGSKVLEVNSNPGLEGITKATKIPVAEHIIRFAAKIVKQKRWLIQKESVIAAA